MIARAIAAMMDVRDPREGKVVLIHTGMDITMITEMGRARARREHGVRMLMRRYLKLSVAVLRRRAECCLGRKRAFLLWCNCKSDK
jgi:hypothetical protein